MRHLLVLTALVAILVGTYFWAKGGTTAISGRIVMHDLDGREVPGSGAKISWYAADAFEERVRLWLDFRDRWKRENDLRLRAARNGWKQKVNARDEAARILRVAEKANAADLEICRARYREAAADAEDALRDLETLASGADSAGDPARLLNDLPPPPVELAAGEDGRFILHAPGGQAGYVVAWRMPTGGRKETLVWLRAVNADATEVVQFSNANIVTAEALARLARERLNRGAPQSSSAE